MNALPPHKLPQYGVPITDPASKSVVQAIDDAPIGRLQITVFALCVMITVLDGFDTQSIAFVAPLIAKEWGLTPFDFGFLFSGTLFGSVIGASLFGAMSDRFGRRKLTITMTLLFGLCSLLSAFATGFSMLLACRIIGGIGLGGVIPNTTAMVSEYSPVHRRTTIVTMTLWGFSAGAVFGGLISAPIIALFGWKTVFVTGGIMPLILVVALLRYLPESLRFLAANTATQDDAARLIQRIAPGQTIDWDSDLRQPGTAPRVGYRALFGSGLASTTIFLSAALFLSLLLTYLLVNWVPSILARSGMSVSSAILGSAAINGGGVLGSYLLSRTLDSSKRPLLFLVGGYVASGLVLALVGGMSGSSTMVLLGLIFCGLFQVGTQMSMSAYTASQFPVALRGAGIGFVQAVGRLGSLFGPIVGGMLISAGLSSSTLFTLCLIPAAATAGMLLALMLIRRSAARDAMTIEGAF